MVTINCGSKGERMETIVGIFKTAAESARAASNLRSMGIPDEHLTLLMPGASEEQLKAVHTSDTEQPGVGAAIGGVVGGALGAAGGLSIGAATATFFVPAVGPVIATGILAAAVLGIGGAVGGKVLGEALDEGLGEGMPRDELFIYEDALRQGRSLVIVLTPDGRQPGAVRRILQQAGAEDIDSAREDWWLGLRDAEEERYVAEGWDFRGDEPVFRSGFEAAQSPQTRGKSYEEAAPYLKARFPDIYGQECFRRGFQRGRNHRKSLIKSFEKTA